MATYIYTVLCIYVQTWVVVPIVVGMFHSSGGLLVYHHGGLSLITVGSLQGLWQTKWPCAIFSFKHFSLPLLIIISSPFNTVQPRERRIYEETECMHCNSHLL